MESRDKEIEVKNAIIKSQQEMINKLRDYIKEMLADIKK